MKKIFDMDGGIMGALTKVSDVLLLNILFIVFSIPVFTMGTSFTAMYYTTVKCIRRERSYVFQSFWKSFKENFRQSVIIGLTLIVFYALFAVNIWYSLRVVQGVFGFVLTVIYGAFGVAVLFTGIYVFPVLSRFELKLTEIIKMSFLMSAKHLPYTILMILIHIICLAGMWFFPPMVLILPAVGNLLCSFMMERVLKKYTPENTNPSEDAWYLE